ncbi:MAG: ParB/RepB/Spo0J family partition protein [Rhodospirillales bacterium]|nr:ParB/RepB/Spo0J family partition protein [Rhodospirillales bacterium]
MAAEGHRRNLGRGLSALLGEDDVAPAGGEPGHGIRTLPIEFLHPSPFQPRHRMNDESLQELAQSIADKGILQPLLVRRDSGQADSYEIIGGERRWRAAQLAQLHEVPVIIRELEDREALEIALIENLQREDLSPLDEADGYRRLKEEFSYTQEELAASLGKSRSHVANTLRLLNLPPAVKEMVDGGVLTAGHARALLNADDPAALAAIVAKRGLNVRQTEKLAQVKAKPAAQRSGGARDPDTLALERDLSNLLGLKVGIRFRGGAGSLTIEYQSLEQLDEILHRLSRGATGTRGSLPTGPGRGDDPIEPLPDDPMEALADFMPADEDADTFSLDDLGLEDVPNGEAGNAATDDLPAFPSEEPKESKD